MTKLQLSDSPERAIRELFEAALSYGASDIHFNPKKDESAIFFRSSGALLKVQDLRAEHCKKVAFALKKLAGVNPVSKKPQDGRIVYRRDSGQEISARFASAYCRMFDADKTTIRLPGKDVNLVSLDNLQFRASDIERFKLALRKNFGLVLVTGPTGSGKTTSLYAALNYIKTLENLNILTAEDPAESPIDGTVQIEPTEAADFADILKSFLRHDPDIIMIGETRNQETAEISVRAALTGHLVLTTLHANTALLSVTRMIDLGVDPFNLIFTLAGLLNQRLIQTLCPKCKIATVPQFEARYLFEKLKRKVPERLYKANSDGCQDCMSGISGRRVVYELLTFDTEDQSKMFSIVKSAASLEESFVPYYDAKYGHKTLLSMAADGVEAGDVAAEEVLKFL